MTRAEINKLIQAGKYARVVRTFGKETTKGVLYRGIAMGITQDAANEARSNGVPQITIDDAFDVGLYGRRKPITKVR